MGCISYRNICLNMGRDIIIGLREAVPPRCRYSAVLVFTMQGSLIVSISYSSSRLSTLDRQQSDKDIAEKICSPFGDFFPFEKGARFVILNSGFDLFGCE